mmetsp:Transcript_12230/g.29816  ORF Transcript_12230/g.29816 Transcript_12230/m.29816 type:complete len:293 (+) Transcript_12230:214-1092(+)
MPYTVSAHTRGRWLLLLLFCYSIGICGKHVCQLSRSPVVFHGRQPTRNVSDVPAQIYCPVCGSVTKPLAWTENIRESGACSVCGANNRVRQLAVAFNYAASFKLRRPLLRVQDAAGLFLIYNTDCYGAFHSVLKDSTGYVCSEYLDNGAQSGALVNGVMHQDLQRTSFAAGTFDFVLSTEVMEHIPNPYHAFSEILRILKPGGAHIFTAPYIPQNVNDDIRARYVNGSLQLYQPPQMHGDSIRHEGILVYTVFGQEMLRRLCRMGYRVHHFVDEVPAFGIVGSVHVFLCWIR